MTFLEKSFLPRGQAAGGRRAHAVAVAAGLAAVPVPGDHALIIIVFLNDVHV